MLTHVALIAVLAAAGDDPATYQLQPLPVVIEEEYTIEQISAPGVFIEPEVEAVQAVDSICTECTCCSSHRSGHWWPHHCGMPLHWAYPPVAHGNYYFRPYHFRDLHALQAFTSSWRGDPRNPYDDELFSDIYAKYAGEIPPLPPQVNGDMERRLPPPQ